MMPDQAFFSSFLDQGRLAYLLRPGARTFPFKQQSFGGRCGPCTLRQGPPANGYPGLYPYRALDSTGQAIDFLLKAKRSLRRAFEEQGNATPRDKHPAAVEAKADCVISDCVILRQCQYRNNVIGQDHRMVKKRVWLAKR